MLQAAASRPSPGAARHTGSAVPAGRVHARVPRSSGRKKCFPDQTLPQTRPKRWGARQANVGACSGPRGWAASWDSRPLRSRKSHSPSIPGRPGPPRSRPAPATCSRAPRGDSSCPPGAPNFRGRPARQPIARAPDRRAGWSGAPHSLLQNRETLWFLRLFRLFAVYPPRPSCQPQKTGSEARKPVFHNGFAVPMGTHRIRTVQRPPIPRSRPRDLSGNRCETHST